MNMRTTTVAGQYYLHGIMEMASGFRIEDNGNFQFFLSYGALDRHGSGKWTISDDQLVLNSAEKPPYDFSLVDSGILPHQQEMIAVKMADANPALLRHVYCSLQGGAEGSWQPMNQHGEALFPRQSFQSVSLLLDMCGERFSTIPVNLSHNAFVFRFEQSIMEVFFKNFTLQLEENGLSGAHPLMRGNIFRYRRN